MVDSNDDVLKKSPCYHVEEVAQLLRDEYRIALGLPIARELMKTTPHIWAACPPVIALAAVETASTRELLFETMRCRNVNVNF